MELEVKLGGITYSVEIDIDDEYVSAVFSVEVYDGQMFVPLSLTEDELDDFYTRYEDDLNEAYQDHKIALAECCAEERWERSMDR